MSRRRFVSTSPTTPTSKDEEDKMIRAATAAWVAAGNAVVVTAPHDFSKEKGESEALWRTIPGPLRKEEEDWEGWQGF